MLVQEVRHTIMGEGPDSGCPCILIRLSGCNLKCKWCDVALDAPVIELSSREIVDLIPRSITVHKALITGGEPFLWDLNDLVGSLVSRGLVVWIETNGSIPVPEEYFQMNYVHLSIDVKTPSSGNPGCDITNLKRLAKATRGTGRIKYVCTDKADVDWAKRHWYSIECLNLEECDITPVWSRKEQVLPIIWKELSTWIGARLNLQVHKFVWPKGPEGTNLLEGMWNNQQKKS